MNKIKLRKPPTAVLVAIIAIIVAVTATVAWFTVGDAVINATYSLSNFDAYAKVYFLQDDSSKLTPTRGSDGSIEVNLNNATSIDRLRVDAYYKGRGAFYMRLKMSQQWSDGTKILQSNAVLPYTIDNGNPWFDNRLDDFCIYYADKIQVANDDYIAVPIITGINMPAFNAMKPAGATLKVAFTLEAVQVNRYPQFWGIQRLPWIPETTTAEETTD